MQWACVIVVIPKICFCDKWFRVSSELRACDSSCIVSFFHSSNNLHIHLWDPLPHDVTVLNFTDAIACEWLLRDQWTIFVRIMVWSQGLWRGCSLRSEDYQLCHKQSLNRMVPNRVHWRVVLRGSFHGHHLSCKFLGEMSCLIVYIKFFVLTVTAGKLQVSHLFLAQLHLTWEAVPMELWILFVCLNANLAQSRLSPEIPICFVGTINVKLSSVYRLELFSGGARCGRDLGYVDGTPATNFRTM